MTVMVWNNFTVQDYFSESAIEQFQLLLSCKPIIVNYSRSEPKNCNNSDRIMSKLMGHLLSDKFAFIENEYILGYFSF